MPIWLFSRLDGQASVSMAHLVAARPSRVLQETCCTAAWWRATWQAQDPELVEAIRGETRAGMISTPALSKSRSPAPHPRSQPRRGAIAPSLTALDSSALSRCLSRIALRYRRKLDSFSAWSACLSLLQKEAPPTERGGIRWAPPAHQRAGPTRPLPQDGVRLGSCGKCVLPCEAALIGNPILKPLSISFRHDVKALLLGGACVHPETASIVAIQEALVAARLKR
jgi:hypothetical protein